VALKKVAEDPLDEFAPEDALDDVKVIFIFSS
jgi:hypothetical protein